MSSIPPNVENGQFGQQLGASSDMSQMPQMHPALLKMLSRMDNQLQQIGSQLSYQNIRWQNIESKLENQNMRMNNIEQQITNMNNLKSSFTKTQTDVNILFDEVKTLKTKMRQYDNNIQKYTDLCDTVVNADASRQTSVDDVMDKLMSIELQQDDLQKQQKAEADKLIDLQWRSMRENLIFSGISEPKLPRGQPENVEMSLRNFLRLEMGITDDIPFDRVHRLGKFDYNQLYPRPIIAKFEKFRDKEFVRKTAPDTLKGKPFGVNEQFPPEIESKRKLLYPEAKKARQDPENKVRMVKDKLYVNGTEVTVEIVGDNDTQDEMNNETSRKQVFTKPDEHTTGARPKTRVVYNYQRGRRSNWQPRGRGSGRGIRRGYNMETWSEPSSPHAPQRGGFRTGNRYVPWNIPTSNYYSLLAEAGNNETPRDKAPGKRYASSPVDLEVSVKKPNENQNQNDRALNEKSNSETRVQNEQNSNDQTNDEEDKLDIPTPSTSGNTNVNSEQTGQNEQLDTPMADEAGENHE